MPSTPILEYMLCCLMVLILVTIYLGYKVEFATFLDKLVFVFSVYMFLHITHIFICQVFCQSKRYIDWAAPFGLMYGPFFFFSAYSYNGKQITRTIILRHTIPFMVGLLGYAIILISENFRSHFLLLYSKILYTAILISFVVYAIRGLLEKQDRNFWSEEKRLVTIAGSLIFVAAIYFFVVTFTSPPAGPVRNYLYIRSGIYLIMLALVAFILRYNVNRLMQPRTLEAPPVMPSLLSVNEQEETEEYPETVENGLPYQKSALPAELLDEYEHKLHYLFREKKNYLDPDLSLQSLAKELKIPKHHLTQLFSIRIGKNFYQYINVFRVEHACQLICKTESGTLETLAFESGFNSKATFNRYFKTIMGCTPSEYREQHLERLKR